MAKNKKIPKVIRIPDLLLRLKGMKDAEYSPSVPDAYVRKLNEKCTAKEACEVRAVETELYPVRKAATNCLTVFFGNLDAISDCSEPSAFESKADIRERRRFFSQRRMLRASVEQAKNDIVMHNETIISSNVLLEERLIQMRKQRDRKLSAYLMGVRQQQPDYSLPVFTDNTPLQTYTEKHSFLDRAITTAAAVILQRDTEEEVV